MKVTNIHSAPAHSLQMMFAQVLWWGIGLTLAYDTAETVFHWPHWLAMALYGSLMIVSAWLQVRAMTMLGIMLVPALMACLYFSVGDAISGESWGALWTQMVSVKALEYLGWFLLVLGSFISGSVFWGNSSHRQKTVLSLLGVVSLGVGAFMMISFAVTGMHASGQSNLVPVVVQQGSYFMWLISVSVKNPQSTQEATCRRAIFVFPRLPVKPLVLMIGTLLVVGYDSVVQHVVGGWQYFTLLLPPLAMMLTRRWGGDVSLLGDRSVFHLDP